MPDLVADLLTFIDRSPTPYHVAEEAARRLRAGGFRELGEEELWDLSPGDRCFVIRNHGSLLALEVGALPPSEGGFRILGAHTDSPNLRLKPKPDQRSGGYRKLMVEPYGGVLFHTWLDRDLSLAGRVTLRGERGPRTLLLDFERPLLCIPSLAIHLNRAVNKEGLKLNPQQHLLPVMGLEMGPDLAEFLTTELRAKADVDVRPGDVLAYDLMTYDAQPASVIGARGEFIAAPRLDNLGSCHAGLHALLDPARRGAAPFTRVLVLYDHEEVGSQSAQGAGGTLLRDALERAVAGFKGGEPQGLSRALARSFMISADMAHAVHPNYVERHGPEQEPIIGRGPVIKVNANQHYASDAGTAGFFAALCERVGVQPQHFAIRSDLTCGSTIGPICAARVGVRTVDVGNPMLSMHSCRELAGTADVEPMIQVLRAYFSAD